MSASERSFLGLAKQVSQGTPITLDTAFQYMLFTEGAVAPQSINLPMDQEIGGGAMLNGVDRVGVSSAGVVSIIPRPDVIGHALLGALGSVAAPVQIIPSTGLAYRHVFTMPADQFDAPFYTVRNAPGGMWGEQFQDMRFASLALTWRAADRVRGQASFMGGEVIPMADLPAEILGTGGGTWDANAAVDRSPAFLAPETAIVFPSETVKVLGGAFTMGMIIPQDEQFITGSYFPDGFDITQRMFSVSLSLKVIDKDLYEKFSYDPAQGGAWTTDLLKEGGFSIEFKSSQLIDPAANPHSLKITGNGQSAASGDGNVIWTATPIALRAGRQVTMNVTGTFVASPTADEPITIELVNDRSTTY